MVKNFEPSAPATPEGTRNMRRSATRLGIIIGLPVAMLVGAYGVARAFNSTGWTAGETLTAADLNTLVNRINALEGRATATGTIVPFAGTSAPSGFLLCDGSAVSRTTYAALFAVIGVTYGVGDAMTTFNLPDLRGEFLRGFDAGRGVDAGRAFGSPQTDAFQGHWHNFRYRGSYYGGSYSSTMADRGLSGTNLLADALDAVNDGTHGVPRVASETRPRNVAVNFIIAL